MYINPSSHAVLKAGHPMSYVVLVIIILLGLCLNRGCIFAGMYKYLHVHVHCSTMIYNRRLLLLCTEICYTPDIFLNVIEYVFPSYTLETRSAETVLPLLVWTGTIDVVNFTFFFNTCLPEK